MANYPFYQPTQMGQAGVYGQPSYYPNMAQPISQQPVQQPIQPVQSAQASQPGFLCRPVASMEEAKAVPTDFSGNILVMTDLSHGAIYTKVLDPSTGSARFDAFARIPDEAPKKNLDIEYAPLDAVNEAVANLNKKIEDLRSDFEGTVYEEVKRVVPAKKGSGKAAE